MTDYKTTYSRDKNVNTLDKGSYNDWGDTTPAKQVLAKQPLDHAYNVSFGPLGEIKKIYNELAAAPVGASTLLVTYTVPLGSQAALKNILVSGDNRGQFEVKINDVSIAIVRTWWANFNAHIPLDNLKLIANDKIEVFVLNRGLTISPFEGTIGADEYAI